MFNRFITSEVQQALLESPAVVLLGPRQVGKTTLAMGLAKADGAYFDLEFPEDRSKLSNVEQTLRGKQDRLVVLDEVQRLPTLFEPLRGLIDHARRNPQGGRKTGLYLRGHQAGQKMGDLSGGGGVSAGG